MGYKDEQINGVTKRTRPVDVNNVSNNIFEYFFFPFGIISVNQNEDVIEYRLRDVPKFEIPFTDISQNYGTANAEEYVDELATLGIYSDKAPQGNQVQKNGFIDYNDSTGAIAITANTWTDIPNNGAGLFTNKSFRPDGITEVLDVSTGYLDFSQLTLGSQLIIRNDFKINPNTNNSLLELRYLLGQGANQYALKFWSERLDSGSGIDYQRVVSFPIYMGDANTQGGPGQLQLKLSTPGTLTNAGSYVNIQLR